jgi:hypothetical protein
VFRPSPQNAKALARTSEVKQAEPNLLRAVMKSLRWKDVVTHRQLRSENERNKIAIAVLVEHGNVQAELLRDGVAEESALADEVQHLRNQIAALTGGAAPAPPSIECTAESLEYAAMSLEPSAFDIEDLPMSPSIVEFASDFMSETMELAHNNEELVVVLRLPPKQPKAESGNRTTSQTKKKPKRFKRFGSVKRKAGKTLASKNKRAVTMSPAAHSDGEAKARGDTVVVDMLPRLSSH